MCTSFNTIGDFQISIYYNANGSPQGTCLCLKDNLWDLTKQVLQTTLSIYLAQFNNELATSLLNPSTYRCANLLCHNVGIIEETTKNDHGLRVFYSNDWQDAFNTWLSRK